MTLTAPERLRGALHDPMLRAKRAEWVRKAVEAGHKNAELSAALGIGSSGLWKIMDQAGIKRPRGQNMDTLRYWGLKQGPLGPVLDAMPKPALMALADTAARAEKPMAAVLADFWAQHHGAQE